MKESAMDQVFVDTQSAEGKKGMSRRKKITLIVLGILLGLFVQISVASYYMAQQQLNQIPGGNPNPGVNQPVPPSPTPSYPERTDNIPESYYSEVPVTGDVIK
jgi:hypothetical protein